MLDGLLDVVWCVEKREGGFGGVVGGVGLQWMQFCEGIVD